MAMLSEPLRYLRLPRYAYKVAIESVCWQAVGVEAWRKRPETVACVFTVRASQAAADNATQQRALSDHLFSKAHYA